MRILIGIAAFLFAMHVFADQAPTWWKLPNKGAACVQKTTFSAQPIDCGVEGFEVWTCIETPPDPLQPSVAKDYLMIGEWKSDTDGECSPTFVVERVIPKEHPKKVK